MTTTTTETAPPPPPSVARVATNTVVQAAGTVLQSLVSLLTFAAVTRYLGPSAYGDLAAATVFLFIPTVLADVGLSAAVLREISATPGRLESAVRNSVALRVAVSLPVVAAATAVAFALPFSDRTRTAVLIGTIGTFFTLMNLSLLPVLQAQLRMHWAVAANLAGRLTTLGLTLAALAAGLGFKSIVVAAVVGLGVTFVVDVIAVWRVVPLRLELDLAYWRKLLRTSVVLGLGLAISLIYFRVDTVILALLRPSEEVGLYSASYKFVEFADVFAYAAVISIFPTMSAFAAAKDPRFKPLAQKGLDVLVAAAVPLAVVLVVAPTTLLDLTSGAKYHDAAPVVQILGLYPLLAFGNSVLWRVLVAAHHERSLLVVSVSILALNVVLNLALIPRYGYKVAAITSLASEACSVTLMIVVARRKVGFRPRLAYVPVLALAAAVMVLVVVGLPGPELVAAVVGALAYAAVLAVVPWTVREMVRDVLASARAARARRYDPRASDA